MDIWDELDSAARANLDEYGLARFFAYKQELRDECLDWEEAFEILSGFIWDELEQGDQF